MINRIKKATKIVDNDVEVIFAATDEIHLWIPGTQKGKKYFVTCLGNIWRCQCTDFDVHGINEETGAHTCKHIVKAIGYLYNLAIENQIEAVDRDEYNVVQQEKRETQVT